MPSIIDSLKMLSDPTRLRIYLLILQEELSVAELQEILGMGQSRISTQLSKLKSEGMAEDRKDGKHSYYRALGDQKIDRLCKDLREEVEEAEADVQALKFVLKKRKDKARVYFDDLAGKFGKQYVPGRSWKALAEAFFKILNYDVVVDFGAGEGTLSQLLAQRAQQVIAIDNSEKMVEFGSNLAKEHGLKNLEYRLGDIEAPPVEDNSVDLAIFSQALHHAKSPEQALSEAYRILKKGGTIVVLDLLEHSFEQARDLYYDTWLGFSECTLTDFLTRSGFDEVQTVVADKETKPPYFATLLAVGVKP